MTTITTINLQALKVSVHAKRDRWERITRCVQAVGGLGEVVFVCDSNRAKYSGHVVQVITSTGMVFVVDVERNLLITGYLASVRATKGMYGYIGQNRVPVELFERVKYNEKRFAYLYNI
jgi:hypothetical protein